MLAVIVHMGLKTEEQVWLPNEWNYVWTI